MSPPLRPIHLIQAAVALVAGFFLSLPFVVALGVDSALRGRTDQAAVIVIAGAIVAGILSSLMALPQTRAILTKERFLTPSNLGHEEPPRRYPSQEISVSDLVGE